jgi:hypothetical protein
MTLSDYEKKQWDDLQKRKAAALSKKARHLFPSAARGLASSASDLATHIPGYDTASEAYVEAAKVLGNLIGNAASHSVNKASVVKQFQDAGYRVEELGSIHNIDLEDVDSVTRMNRLRYWNAGLAAIAGVGSAAVITGAETLAAKGTVAGEGAKNAPRLASVGVAIASDLSALITLAARTTASTAQYYGYDPRLPEEQIFMMSVLGLGMATGAPAKAAAYSELSQLTQLLFRNATWDKLNEKILTKIVQKFATKLSINLTKKELGKVVPVLGMAIGGGLNYATIDRVAQAANDAYRERFLIERSGGDLSTLNYDSENPIKPNEQAISLIGLLEEDGVLTSGDLAGIADSEDGS